MDRLNLSFDDPQAAMLAAVATFIIMLILIPLVHMEDDE